MTSEDTTTTTEADAATHARRLGHHEHIGGHDDQEPEPLLARTVGADPWLPWDCPRCGDEDRTGMPQRCPCGWVNYGPAS